VQTMPCTWTPSSGRAPCFTKANCSNDPSATTHRKNRWIREVRLKLDNPQTFADRTVVMAVNWLSGALRWPIGRHFPQGVYPARDIKRFFPNLRVEEIFDIGANIGQSAVQYAINYRAARIDSFEPLRKPFDELEKRTSRNPRIHCHNLALGSSSGVARMDTMNYTYMSRMSDDGDETVTVTTAVEFTRENHIDHINLFKVDTEGFDLEVLRGAEQLIRERRIDLIQVEAGMNPENTHHVYFENFTQYLHGFDYRLFGIYHQFYEWPTRSPKLRRCDLMFASPQLI
jgi:FkbM family methyltransferase